MSNTGLLKVEKTSLTSISVKFVAFQFFFANIYFAYFVYWSMTTKIKSYTDFLLIHSGSSVIKSMIQFFLRSIRIGGNCSLSYGKCRLGFVSLQVWHASTYLWTFVDIYSQ